MDPERPKPKPPPPSRRTRILRALSMAVWIGATLLLVTAMWATRFGTRWPNVYLMTGPSMEPTIGEEQYFVAWDPPGELSRGDLVIFQFPYRNNVFHVLRRVVAFGGDSVSMRAGAVFVNGGRQPWAFQVLEPRAWRSTFARDSNLYDWGPWVVPDDSLMLLSDTRDILGWPDSRFIGFVAPSDIVARATRTITLRRLH